ncbi:MAG: hypothetical protein DMG24_17820 [Acidobacteria bacterium]|nr:MAG: hypothetical protein DMG24_17820 [Acidobacteriota bacterium]
MTGGVSATLLRKNLEVCLELATRSPRSRGPTAAPVLRPQHFPVFMLCVGPEVKMSQSADHD